MHLPEKPDGDAQEYSSSSYIRDYAFTGLVRSYDPASGIAVVEQRNKMDLGDMIEVFGPKGDAFSQKLDYMTDEEGNPVSSAPHPQQILHIKMAQPVAEMYMIRKEK